MPPTEARPPRNGHAFVAGAPTTAAAGHEPDPVFFVVDQHVVDMAEVERNGPVLGCDLVPAGLAEGVPKAGQLGRGHPGAQHLSSAESDADLLRLLACHVQ
jgi:hypothetical protein